MHQKENANVNIAQKMGRTFNPSELKMMLGQCLKLASENKITAQNTWGLPLIEHLPELVKEDQPGETNFQKASVTLDAGVKIYSYRVDSVHTETFKILGGIGRAQGPTNDDGEEEGDDTNPDGSSPTKRRRRHAELNPEATLEPSLEALNVKKFDLAFAVDPLFHKTSAQFDEGGAKGLLLANLSVYRGCDIVFDSMDVPEQAGEAAAAVAQAAGPVNLSSITPQLEAVRKLQQEQEKNTDDGGDAAVGHHRMSPALDDILSLLGLLPTSNDALAADDFVQRVASGHVLLPTTSLASSRSDVASLMMAASERGEGGMMTSYDEQIAAEYAEMNAGIMMDDDHDMGGGGFDDNDGADGDFTNGASHHQHGFGSAAALLDKDAVQWLIDAGNEGGSSSGKGAGGVMAAKGWAGASHWRYKSALPPPGTANGTGRFHNGEDGEASSSMTNNTRGSRRRNEPLDFVALMMENNDGAGEPDFERLPRYKGGAGGGMRRKKPVANTLLPEDHHYAAECLVRYALRPSALIVVGGGDGVHGKEERGAGGGGGGVFGEYGVYNDMNDDDDGYGDDDGGGGGEWMMSALLEGEGALELVDAARRVEKVEVGYSRAAKQVDVKSLKELMWDGLQNVMEERRARGVVDVEGEPIHLGEVLATVPEMNAAGRLEDLSVHLCFICVLHLANEHGLVVRGVEGLDELLVSNVPVMAAG